MWIYLHNYFSEQPFIINTVTITTIEQRNHNTTISFVGGEYILVKENLKEILKLLNGTTDKICQ